jgi:hypothetical protein
MNLRLTTESVLGFDLCRYTYTTVSMGRYNDARFPVGIIDRSELLHAFHLHIHGLAYIQTLYL